MKTLFALFSANGCSQRYRCFDIHCQYWKSI